MKATLAVVAIAAAASSSVSALSVKRAGAASCAPTHWNTTFDDQKFTNLLPLANSLDGKTINGLTFSGFTGVDTTLLGAANANLISPASSPNVIASGWEQTGLSLANKAANISAAGPAGTNSSRFNLHGFAYACALNTIVSGAAGTPQNCSITVTTYAAGVQKGQKTFAFNVTQPLGNLLGGGGLPSVPSVPGVPGAPSVPSVPSVPAVPGVPAVKRQAPILPQAAAPAIATIDDPTFCDIDEASFIIDSANVALRKRLPITSPVPGLTSAIILDNLIYTTHC